MRPSRQMARQLRQCGDRRWDMIGIAQVFDLGGVGLFSGGTHARIG